MPRPWRADEIHISGLRHYTATARRGYQAQAVENAALLYSMVRVKLRHIPRRIAIALFLHYCEHIPRPLTAQMGFDEVPLDMFTVRECATLFRFSSADELRHVAQLLGIPAVLPRADSRHGYRAPGLSSFACMLARLVVPQRLSDLRRSLRLNWSEAKISSNINAIMLFLFDRWGGRVRFDHRFFVDEQQCHHFAQCIRQARPHCKLKNIVGVLDGTYVELDRPGEMQMYFYSGYRGGHCLLFQGIVMPNGLITSMWGPFRGMVVLLH